MGARLNEENTLDQNHRVHTSGFARSGSSSGGKRRIPHGWPPRRQIWLSCPQRACPLPRFRRSARVWEGSRSAGKDRGTRSRKIPRCPPRWTARQSWGTSSDRSPTLFTGLRRWRTADEAESLS